MSVRTGYSTKATAPDQRWPAGRSEGENTMAVYRRSLMLLTVIGLLCAPGWAFGQEATPPSQHVPLQKTIGGSTKARVEPSLIVLNADSATLSGDKLTLNGIAT